MNCIFNMCCVIFVLFCTKCCLFHNFIFLCSVNTFFINRALKLKYQPGHLKVQHFYILLLQYIQYFSCRIAGQKSVSGRFCDRPPRHRFFLVSLCLKANAEMVPKIPSCHYMLLMWPSRLKFSSNQFHVLCTCKITTATG